MFNSLLENIGNTRIAELNFGQPFTLLAKLEYLNPGGSIKDRSALYMIEHAEREGKLKDGGTIVEASSGNQGIALAMIGAVKGYQVIITVPQHTSGEKVNTLRAYGAEVIVCKDTHTLSDPDSYHSVAVRKQQEIPGAFMPNQYMNRINPQAHYEWTGPEIWRQMQGKKFTHFICGMGSCGTVSGVGKYLKEQDSSIQVVGVDSANSLLSSDAPSSYESEGIGVDVIGETLNQEVIDRVIPVHDRDAFRKTRELASRGLLLGISSGAVMHGLDVLSTDLSAGDVVLAIFADSGRAYLNKVFSENALFQDEKETNTDPVAQLQRQAAAHA